MATTVVTLGSSRKAIMSAGGGEGIAGILARAGIIPPAPKTGDVTVALANGQPSTFTLATITDYNGTTFVSGAWADQADTALTPDQVAIISGVDGIMPILGKCAVMPGLATWSGSVKFTFDAWQVKSVTITDPLEPVDGGGTQAYAPDEGSW